MLSAFDLDKLYGLLKDFYQITRIRITVFDGDLTELVSYPAEVAPVCQIIRSCAAGLSACSSSDHNACAEASRKGTTYIYRCHAGLTEAVTPLYVGNVLVGYLLFGHVFSFDNQSDGLATIRSLCKDLPIDMDALDTHILRAVASYLILERMATLQEDKVAVQLDAYLSAHFTEQITSTSLCERFRLGRTQLYKIANQLYGCGITQHIRDLRVDLAKNMLKDQMSLPIAEVAERCGYHDYNYFIAVFSKTVGVSPGLYRKS